MVCDISVCAFLGLAFFRCVFMVEHLYIWQNTTDSNRYKNKINNVFVYLSIFLRGVRGVDALNHKDTQVNLTSPWCTPVTSTLCWANEAMAKGRKTPKINLLRRANNLPSSNDVTETRSEFQKPA